MMFTTTPRQQIKMDPLSIPETVITQMSKESFSSLLKENTGLVFIKFGAEWCAPCKRIEPLVIRCMTDLVEYENVKCAIIDVDDNFEIYAFLKSKKMVNGVPTILCYFKGNLTYVPDKVVVGADDKQVQLFFQECMSMLN